MRYLKRILGTLLVAAVPVLAWASVAHSQHFSPTVEQGQTVYSAVYSAGNEVRIKGTVYGDVFCAGQKITIDAVVYGDVICAGQDISVTGKIEGDVRVAGQLVSVGGEIGKNVTAAALNFSLDADAKVGQDVTAKGEVLNLKGAVGRDAIVGGTHIDLNGPIGRNVRAEGANLTLKDKALVAGNLVYSSHKQAEVDQKAKVAGETEHLTPPRRGFNVALFLFAVTSLTLIGMVLAYVFPRLMQKTTAHIASSAPKTMLIGVLGSLVMIGVSLGLLLTLVGLPLALVVLLALLCGVVLSGPITAYYVGTLVLRKRRGQSPLLIAFVGGILLVTAYHLPLAGLLFLLLAFWLGFGALLLTIKPYVGMPAPKKK